MASIGRLAATTRSISSVFPVGRSFVGFLGLVFLLGALAQPLRMLLPVYVESELHRPPTFSSTLLLLMLASGGVFALLGGTLAARLGQKRTLVIGMGALLFVGPLYLVQGPEALLVLALAAGLLDGIQVVGSQSYLVAGTPRAYLGMASALFFLGSTFGSSLGSIGAGAAVESWGFGSLGIIGLIAAVFLIAAAAHFLPDLGGKQMPSPTVSSGALGSYARIIRRPSFFPVIIIRFLPTCFWGVAMLLMPLLLYRLSESVLAVSAYNAVSLAVAAGCQLLTGRISDRLGRGLPVLVICALLPLCMLATALTTGSFAGLFVVGVITTAVAWSLSVNFPPLVREFTDESEHGQALGLLHLLWVIGMLLGTGAGGILIETNPTLPFILMAILNVPTAVAGWAIWRKLHPANGPDKPTSY